VNYPATFFGVFGASQTHKVTTTTATTTTKGKGKKIKLHPITGHEDPEGE
jgi:hypothetical protein